MMAHSRLEALLLVVIGLGLGAAGCTPPRAVATSTVTSPSGRSATPPRARTTTTLTPRATRIRVTVTPSPMPTPDLAQAALRLEDLPPGFEAIDTLTLGLDPAGLEPHGLRVDQTFAYMHPREFQFVLGFLTLLGSTTDRFVFDSLASSPRVVAEALVSPSGLLQLQDVQPLTVPGLGDASGAISAKLHTTGVVFHTELVMFRDDSVGAVLVVARLDGDLPVTTLSEMAQVLLARMRRSRGA